MMVVVVEAAVQAWDAKYGGVCKIIRIVQFIDLRARRQIGVGFSLVGRPPPYKPSVAASV